MQSCFRASILVAATAGLTLLVNSCKTVHSNSGLRDDGKVAANVSPSVKGPTFCAGIRGNGNLIFGHFASLARIIEHYGLIGGMAGGSSASVTTFIYESMYANPMVWSCGDKNCNAEESAARVSLLLKSLQEYMKYIRGTDEVVAFEHLAPIVTKIKASGVGSLIAEERLEAAGELQKVLTSSEIRGLINPEVIQLLKTSPNLQFHVKSIYDEVLSFGDWGVEDETIFFRPGLINFQVVAAKLGRIGSFYAGYEPADKAGMQHFLTSCATAARGKNWLDAKTLPAGQGETCGQVFNKLIASFHSTLQANESQYRSRIDDSIGKYIPALIATSLLKGPEAVGIYNDARQRYLKGEPIDFQFKNFDHIKFGYWGRAIDLKNVASNTMNYDDKKTAKFESLGEATWRTALSYSPAEPGLARFLEIDDNTISAGGWSDLHPVLVLKNMGCQNVIYVNRKHVSETEFVLGLTQKFGATAADHAALYDLDTPQNQPESSYKKSIRAADAVWCTNWNAFSTEQISEISADAFNAPMEVRSKFFKKAKNPYINAKDNVNLRSCSPDAPPDAL